MPCTVYVGSKLPLRNALSMLSKVRMAVILLLSLRQSADVVVGRKHCRALSHLASATGRRESGKSIRATSSRILGSAKCTVDDWEASESLCWLKKSEEKHTEKEILPATRLVYCVRGQYSLNTEAVHLERHSASPLGALQEGAITPETGANDLALRKPIAAKGMMLDARREY